jgi:hypothetical protein
MANNLVQVEAYANELSPYLNAYLTYGDLADKAFEGWNQPGNRGDTVLYRNPTLFSLNNSLSFDQVNDGMFTEQFGALTIDTEASIPVQMTDQEIQTYHLDELMDQFGISAMKTLAGNVDQQLAITACLGGYRWVGDINAGPTSLLDQQQLRVGITQFRNFGGYDTAYCVLPDIATTRILNTGLQEFTPVTNDASVKDWELGSIRGSIRTKIYQSQLNPIHISGTLSEAGEVIITNVASSTYILPGTTNVVPASEITISAANGLTVVENDLGDIGTQTGAQPFNREDAIKFLRPQDKTICDINPQFKVVEGGTVAGQTLTFKVIPELKFDPTEKDPLRNLNRAIVPATDKLRIVKSHKCGVIWLGNAFKFAAPKLPTRSPYDSGVKVDQDTKIAYRVYHGAVFNTATSFMVHDLRYGKSMEPAYAARMIFPLDSTPF